MGVGNHSFGGSASSKGGTGVIANPAAQAAVGSHNLSLSSRLRAHPHLVSEAADGVRIVSVVEPLHFFTPVEDQLSRPHFRHSIPRVAPREQPGTVPNDRPGCDSDLSSFDHGNLNR
jgi:hypothetical protein